MTATARHDAWEAGDNYDAYMGRWSRALAPRFLDWLGAAPEGDWLDVGCGTGALSAAIVAQCNPRSVISVDVSDSFVAKAQASVRDGRVDIRVGNAERLDLPAKSRDVVVSALVLNFLPKKQEALAEQERVARSAGTIGFYVWDYPGHGLEFVDAFWRAAASLDPAAMELDEARRFPFCTPDGLTGLAAQAGLTSVECTAIEVPTIFKDFEDFWQPFTLGSGPAPGYCASLTAESRQRLKETLYGHFARPGSIDLVARAWAVRSRVT